MSKAHQADIDLQEQADKLFLQAAAIESDTERFHFIEKNCQDNPTLRSEIDRLFAMQDTPELFEYITSPATISVIDVTNTLTDIPEFFELKNHSFPDDDEVGKQIGNYKLLQKIGEGGVGNVYLAEQSKPVRRQVALKIIKAGMDTKSVIARFEAERQALAMMEHPNIASVLNAGETETGRPYFVMELVHGERITTYCDENNLNIRQRLNLFIQVCHAIQHAHQKGIIHRDIKPSNVLITTHDGMPNPVVIDFGIAKATTEELLTDKTVNTGIGPIIGTPAYMSPEQADTANTDIDTRSDIYSLGALLYELLVDQPPFNQKELLKSGLEEMCRTLREREPLMPSVKFSQTEPTDQINIAERRCTDPRKLGVMLAGDLDGIVMMALEKDRSRRYETVNLLSMDIEHYLNHEPVMARPPSRLYRFQKLVRRNKTTFAYLTIVAVALTVGFGTSTWLFFREREARNSERQARQSEQKLMNEADARSKIAQAALMLSRNQPEEADTIMDKIQIPVVEPSLEAANVFRILGEWNVFHGRWKEASKRFSKLVYANRVDKSDLTEQVTIDLLSAAPAMIVAGHTNAYHDFVNETLNHYEDTADPVAAEQILKACLLLPADPAVLHRLAPLDGLLKNSIETATDPNYRNDYRFAWRFFSMGLYEYRRGNYAEALRLTEQSIDSTALSPPRVVMSHELKALALKKLEKKEESAQELDIARQTIQARLPNGLHDITARGSHGSGFWNDWTIAYLLLQEAETLTESHASGNENTP